jgi:hypothetical protein
MVKKELLRHLKSKHTLFLVVAAILIASFSFFSSLAEKKMFIGQMSSDAPDLDKGRLLLLIEEYTGVKFYADFWFVSDFSIVYTLILFLWVGVFLSGQLQAQKELGFGNLIVSRISYFKYFRYTFIAHSLYIVAMVSGGALIQFAFALIIGGAEFTHLRIGIYDLGLPSALLSLFAQTLQLAMLALLVNGMCLTLNVWIKNKYVIQILPVVGFSLLPMILGGTVANLSGNLGALINLFIPYRNLTSIYRIYQEAITLSALISAFLPIAVYIMLFVLLFIANTQSNKKSCL